MYRSSLTYNHDTVGKPYTWSMQSTCIQVDVSDVCLHRVILPVLSKARGNVEVIKVAIKEKWNRFRKKIVIKRKKN
jgi:hypothetical protein